LNVFGKESTEFWVEMDKKQPEENNQRMNQERGEKVYDVVRARIFSGLYWPRQHLVESTLSEELRVTRSAVREALKRLTAEGLVVSERNRGSFVAVFSLKEAFDTYQVEAFLEGSAAYLSTHHIGEEEINKLSGLIEHCCHLGDQDLNEWAKCNREIHRIFNAGCGNRRLLDLIKNNVKFMKYRFIVISQRLEIHRRNNEHKAILEALRRGDPLEVRAAVENHILAAGKDMLNRLEGILPDSTEKKTPAIASGVR
jgi:DNA-binding GntR family transcriptional regulator